MILSEIIVKKRQRVEEAKARISLEELRRNVLPVSPRNGGFKSAISRAHRINLIAELKKASPIQGVLREDFDPVTLATFYKIAGAAAVSVLTEEDFFLGRLDYVRAVKPVGLPVLRKDFVVDPYQIYETAAAGADALLLISDLLTLEQLGEYITLAQTLGLDVLVEVHNEEDLDKAVRAGAQIIGINNRNLHTFKVDLAVTKSLLPLVPPGKVVVSESGIHSHDNVMFLKSLNVHAILVGEIFMRSDDVERKVRELMG